MRYPKLAYVGAILILGIGSVVLSSFYSEHDIVILSFGQVLLAVMTFPLGFVAAAAGAALVASGIMAPAETLVLITPVHAALGYVQWWRLLPALYRTRS
ncbi:MAG: hypothetical protein KL863_20605 [Rhizobium sp.]|nr:hypothetical protein [Rhizobium sp.]